MKKKALFTAAVSMIFSVFMSAAAFAGQWQSDASGWWWQNDDGSYPANTWQWLDGNGDGVAECYYFDGNGYMMAAAVTPDGYTVDGNGAWTVNGVVQTQNAADTSQSAVNTSQGTQAVSYSDDYSGVYSVPYYDANGSLSYHPVTLTYDPASNAITYSDPLSGYSAIYTYFGAGLNGWTSFELVSAEEKSSIFFSAPGVLQAWGWDDFVPVTRN